MNNGTCYVKFEVRVQRNDFRSVKIETRVPEDGFCSVLIETCSVESEFCSEKTETRSVISGIRPVWNMFQSKVRYSGERFIETLFYGIVYVLVKHGISFFPGNFGQGITGR